MTNSILLRRLTFCMIASTAQLVVSLDATLAAGKACDPKEDGDCCTSSTDCVAFVNETLCSIEPLNKVKAQELQKEGFPDTGLCSAERRAGLKEDAKKREPYCDRGACGFVE